MNSIQFNSIQTLGFYIETWATIERIINVFIVRYHSHNKKKMYLPDTLQEKVKYLFHISTDTRFSNEIRSKFKQWGKSIDEEASYRHFIVHGVGRSKWNGESFQWTYEYLRLTKSGPEIKKKIIEQDEFSRRLDAIGTICSDMSSTLKPILWPDTQISSAIRP